VSESERSTSSRWYRDAIIYEVHVRAFADSNADGIGDFPGLTSRLDHLADLGVTAVWLLPFYPSPIKDDGYDIADYRTVHPAYGTLRDFRTFLREARRRGLRVITELVLNHTSDQHPWFQRARRSPPGSAWRDFYVWSDTPDRYPDARVIFKDYETSNWSYDPVAGAYFWHRFYSSQPDLNYDSPQVRQAMFDVVDHWLAMGVDGLRLDAVPYLFERDGTTGENLPETHDYLKQLRRHIDERFPDRMLLAEANQWPEDAVSYFGDGDESNMAFHFPLMPRMFMATRMEERYPVVDILNETPPIPESCQWALFLRNHDELTLEMVTDEERDYMYRVYAEDPQARLNLGIRRRLAPLLGNNRRLIEMMNGLLLTLPGTPVVYYGDEIGMGDNIYLGDRNGVRTPMQWTGGRNAGFSHANPQKLYLPVIIDPEYHPAAVNVETEEANPYSLLWWMKRIIAIRKRFRAFGRGSLEFLFPENRKVLAFLRRFEDEVILVVANLSRYAQPIELDLGALQGMVPVELFGGTEFPVIQDRPYVLTLGPYAFTWYSVEAPRVSPTPSPPGAAIPALEVAAGWEEVLTGPARHALEVHLPAYLAGRRWFRSKSRRMKGAQIVDAVPVHPVDADGMGPSYVAMVSTEYVDGESELYALPLSAAPWEPTPEQPDPPHPAPLARVRGNGGQVVVFDALGDRAFGTAVLRAMARRRTLTGERGRIQATATPTLRRICDVSDVADPAPVQAEQSNTSIVFGDRLILKLFRRLEPGLNPEVEMERFLTERAAFPHSPPLAGTLEYAAPGSRPMSLGILQGFVPNEGDAWLYTLDALRSYVEETDVLRREIEEPPLPARTAPLELAGSEPPELARELFGGYLESARQMGARTAELHLALSMHGDDPAFAPEPFTPHYQRAALQASRTLAARVFAMARDRVRDIPQLVQIVDLESEVVARLARLAEVRIDAMRTRIHGDYHLGQVLHTGRDFVIIDFEGEPARPLGERRIKRSPLVDVVGMLRSFHYAAYRTLLGEDRDPETYNPSVIEPWVLFWYDWVSSTFLRSYLESVGPATILPTDDAQLAVLLDALLIEKSLSELRYEVDNRPGWARLAIQGLLRVLEDGT
jgi:maltose alpha-D-glucosyltransferase / alpha-amylase